MCVLSNPHLSLPPDLAPHKRNLQSEIPQQVAGFHRAVPSTTLDKAYMQFPHYSTRKSYIVKYCGEFF